MNKQPLFHAINCYMLPPKYQPDSESLNQFFQFKEQLENGSISIEEYFESILKLDCFDCRVFAEKANAYYYMYKHNNKNNSNYITSAIREIGESIKILDLIASYQNGKTHEEPMMLSAINGDIPIANIYFLAGELYAMNGDSKKSLDYYKQYHLQLLSNSLQTLHLYTFRNLSEYSLSDLANNTITLTTPTKMNDPFDTPIIHWIKCKECKNNFKKHISLLSKSYDLYRIRSFCTEIEGKRSPVLNQLMWAHYANSHSGFCVKYKFDPEFTQRDDMMLCFKKVKYENENFDINKVKMDTVKGFCSKTKDWKYEDEVRLIAYSPTFRNDHFNLPMGKHCQIEAIYFGLNCSDRNKKIIKKLLKSNKIEYYNMIIDADRYFELSFVPDK